MLPVLLVGAAAVAADPVALFNSKKATHRTCPIYFGGELTDGQTEGIKLLSRCDIEVGEHFHFPSNNGSWHGTFGAVTRGAQEDDGSAEGSGLNLVAPQSTPDCACECSIPETQCYCITTPHGAPSHFVDHTADCDTYRSQHFAEHTTSVKLEEDRSLDTGSIVGISIGSVGGLVIIVLVVYVFIRRRRYQGYSGVGDFM